MSKSPEAAPRGKAFRVVRLNHVVGGKVLPVLMPGRWLARGEADNACRAIDERLNPRVVLLSEVAPEVSS